MKITFSGATHHCVVTQTMAPRDLHDNIKLDKVIAGVKHTNIAFPAANVDELGAPISKNISKIEYFILT